MIIRDGFDRFVTTFDSKKLLEKVIENEENAKIAFESGLDHTTRAAFTVEGDCEAVWNKLIESGVPCMSKV